MLYPHRLISFVCLSIFSSTPLIFSPKVEAQNVSVSEDNSVMEIAQATQADMLYNQMNQYMGAAFQGIPVFANGLGQMQTMQNEQQLYTLLQQLIPIATNVAGNFNQAYQIGQQLTPMIPANSPYATIVQQWTLLNGQGANTFASWIDTLMPMQQALQTQNVSQMESAITRWRYAIAQMQNAVNQTITLANGLQAVTQQTNNILASYQNAQATANSVNYGNDMTMAEYEMMSRMSNMMHETNMSIINNMGSDGEWRYNYSTGEDEYIYY
ncbi:hypothetical protein H6G11_08115 [Cyanobacterium aponinum FACHB-4101]|uniref:hypothetical protein n=1 Tax=Cyanobacterium aponinum TaxID=379064 RepID=UPI001680E2C1|nr:hypothetical protein [Cyanobacterium aponinum]MBD2394222.1 hypothetical protein [Cyanobacterium aponinum FACHB-4101]